MSAASFANMPFDAVEITSGLLGVTVYAVDGAKPDIEYAPPIEVVVLTAGEPGALRVTPPTPTGGIAAF
jgi:hypothetical protein